jgi:hypothetical protein
MFSYLVLEKVNRWEYVPIAIFPTKDEGWKYIADLPHEYECDYLVSPTELTKIPKDIDIPIYINEDCDGR